MSEDIRRLETLRAGLGDEIPIMVDANQQWDRVQALQFCREVDHLRPEWIEEPLDAYDVIGHAALSQSVDSPIASGEMISEGAVLRDFIGRSAVDVLQPDAARIGGVTPYLKVADLAHEARLRVAPHFIMEIHIHLAACYPTESWVEHFEWLEPLFTERLAIREGRMYLPDGPGLGLTVSDYFDRCVKEETLIGDTK